MILLLRLIAIWFTSLSLSLSLSLAVPPGASAVAQPVAESTAYTYD